MNDQEIQTLRQTLFNRAVSGVIAQGRPCELSNTACLYRGESAREWAIKQQIPYNPDEVEALKGLKCGVGHLINDDQYDLSYEGRSVSDDRVMRAVMASNGYPDTIPPSSIERMLRQVQSAHDSMAKEGWRREQPPLEIFTEDMEKLASDFGLKMPEVPQKDAA